jgi:glycosyltransferase involved in cell wall biosynthesis
MPVYNAESFVEQSIRSILAQTFTDFELIVIDDGSDDKSLSILEKFKNTDSRVRLISRKNLGIVDTRNEGVDLIRGEWMALMDADDISLPHRFEKQLEWAKFKKADICGSWIKFFGELDSRVVQYPVSDSAIKMALFFGCPFANPSIMVKSELIKRLRYFKESSEVEGYAEDYDFYVRAVEAGCTMTNVPEVLLNYRQHKSQTTKIKFLDNHHYSQKIRRRYWNNQSKSMDIKRESIDEIIKIHEIEIGNINLTLVNEALTKILLSSNEEAREIGFQYIREIFFRIAAYCPDISQKWWTLTEEFNPQKRNRTKYYLFLLSKFKIHKNGVSYQLLRYIYRRFTVIKQKFLINNDK